MGPSLNTRITQSFSVSPHGDAGCALQQGFFISASPAVATPEHTHTTYNSPWQCLVNVSAHCRWSLVNVSAHSCRQCSPASLHLSPAGAVPEHTKHSSCQHLCTVLLVMLSSRLRLCSSSCDRSWTCTHRSPCQQLCTLFFLLPGSSYLEPTPSLCPSFYLSVLSDLPWKLFSFENLCLQSHCPDIWLHIYMCVCVCVCMRACMRVCVFVCVCVLVHFQT